jgi:hypothetical protein
VAADSDGFNDMDNDAFSTWLLTWQLTWTTTMAWHDDVEFLRPLSDGPYFSSGSHFGPEFQPLEIISAHQKYLLHLTHRIINIKIFHTEFSAGTQMYHIGHHTDVSCRTTHRCIV